MDLVIVKSDAPISILAHIADRCPHNETVALACTSVAGFGRLDFASGLSF